MAGFQSRITHEGTEAPEWTPIAEWPEYEITPKGDIRRRAAARGTRPGRVIKQTKGNHGYIVAKLWRENRGKAFLVHRLVYATFAGPLDKTRQINHINADRTDNRVENLEQVTQQENLRHGEKVGRRQFSGERNPMARLTADQVIRIRKAHANGDGGYKALGAKFAVPWGTIRNIVTRRTWPNV